MGRKAKIMLGDSFETHLEPNGFSNESIYNIMKSALERCLQAS